MSTAAVAREKSGPSRQPERPSRPEGGTREAGSPEEPEEVLVADVRAGLTPTDMVERKLLYLLRGAPVAGSHVRMGGPRGRGGPKEAAHRTTGAA